MDLKSELRLAALARRDALGVERRRDASERAASIGRTVAEAGRGKIVSGYWPIRSEADPRPWLSVARESGATLALPVLEGPEVLRFRRWNADETLVPAGFGTVGPPPSAPYAVPDLILMPLAAFDRRLHRIGYGKGHYDRAIAALRANGRHPLLVGLAFAVQEVDKVPFEPHDIPLDAIVTEDELIAVPSSSGEPLAPRISR